MKTDQEKLDAAEPIGVTAAIAHLTERNAPTIRFADFYVKQLSELPERKQAAIRMMPTGLNARVFEQEARKAYVAFVKPNTERKSEPATARKNLGFVNGWKETPQIVSDCEAAGHKRRGTHDGTRCLSETFCDICNYKFSMDSGD